MSPQFSTSARRASTLAATAGAVLAASASAASAAPTGDFADFAQCPVNNPNTTACVYTEATSGNFKLGNADVPINKAIKLQFGYRLDPDTGATDFIPAANGQTLSKTPLKVPGGLTGLMTDANFGGPLLQLLTQAINSVNDVTATAELVGPVDFGFFKYAAQEGTAVGLPLRIKLDNPFLGDKCYVGSAANPVRINLTSGTTAPPAPASPITGDVGALEFLYDGDLIKGNGFKLVDNAFSVPAAKDCGPLGFRFLVTPVVNLKEGFPAAAGKNSATLRGSLKVATKERVVASAG
jgi:hypothetical protein